MMDTSSIKLRAKAALGRHYWLLVGLVLLAAVLGASTGAAGFSFSIGSDGDSFYSEEIQSLLKTTAVAAACIGVAYIIFVGNVARVGASRLCLSAYRGESFGILDLFHGFRSGRYGRVAGTMALSTLFVFLGCLLFVIPGVVVALGLFPLPYILAENDEVSGMDAIRMAWETSKGHKGGIFIFELSFIGWILLNLLTFGVLGIFFLNPYMELSLAGYYSELTRPEVCETAWL